MVYGIEKRTDKPIEKQNDPANWPTNAIAIHSIRTIRIVHNRPAKRSFLLFSLLFRFVCIGVLSLAVLSFQFP